MQRLDFKEKFTELEYSSLCSGRIWILVVKEYENNGLHSVPK